MSNGLDPDQAQQNVGPGLDPNHLKMRSIDDEIATSRCFGIFSRHRLCLDLSKRMKNIKMLL